MENIIELINIIRLKTNSETLSQSLNFSPYHNNILTMFHYLLYMMFQRKAKILRKYNFSYKNSQKYKLKIIQQIRKEYV